MKSQPAGCRSVSLLALHTLLITEQGEEEPQQKEGQAEHQRCPRDVLVPHLTTASRKGHAWGHLVCCLTVLLRQAHLCIHSSVFSGHVCVSIPPFLRLPGTQLTSVCKVICRDHQQKTRNPPLTDSSCWLCFSTILLIRIQKNIQPGDTFCSGQCGGYTRPFCDVIGMGISEGAPVWVLQLRRPRQVCLSHLKCEHKPDAQIYYLCSLWKKKKIYWARIGRGFVIVSVNFNL